VPLQERSIEDLEWRGARERFKALCLDLGIKEFPEYVNITRSNRTG
jgi:hypothetical protein